MTSFKSQAIRLINQKIKWHKNNRDNSLTTKEMGMFLKGLKQAKIILRKI